MTAPSPAVRSDGDVMVAYAAHVAGLAIGDGSRYAASWRHAASWRATPTSVPGWTARRRHGWPTCTG